MADDSGFIDEEDDRNNAQFEEVFRVEHDGEIRNFLPLKEELHAVSVLLGSDGGEGDFAILLPLLRLRIPPG